MKQILANAHPSLLIIGPCEQAYRVACDQVLSYLCGKGEDCFCSTCVLVRSRQHPACIVVDPEQGYTVKLLELILPLFSFKRTEKEPLFIIWTNAHTMTDTVANRLLKPIEEPPLHLYSLFIASDLSRMHETIVSRCKVYHLPQETSEENFFEMNAEQMAEALSKNQFHHEKIPLLLSQAQKKILKASRETWLEEKASSLLSSLSSLPPVSSGSGTLFAKYISCIISPLSKK